MISLSRLGLGLTMLFILRQFLVTDIRVLLKMIGYMLICFMTIISNYLTKLYEYRTVLDVLFFHGKRNGIGIAERSHGW